MSVSTAVRFNTRVSVSGELTVLFKCYQSARIKIHVTTINFSAWAEKGMKKECENVH